MKINQLKILNFIITIVFIFINILTEKNFDLNFSQDVAVITMIGFIMNSYLTELE